MSNKTMNLKDKYSEALEITGKTLEEFLKWIHSFEESYITVKDKRRIKTIYTDGDGGIIIFRAHCDMFDGEGMEVSVLGVGYCEIPYCIMQNMLFDIEEAASFADSLNDDNEE